MQNVLKLLFKICYQVGTYLKLKEILLVYRESPMMMRKTPHLIIKLLILIKGLFIICHAELICFNNYFKLISGVKKKNKSNVSWQLLLLCQTP